MSSQRVGSCHLAEDPAELAAMSSDTAPPVSCSTPHQTETMWMMTVTGPLAGASRRPNGELFNKLVSGSCYDYFRERSYLGAGPNDVVWGIALWARYPTAADWAKGARTLVCQGSTSTDTPIGPTVNFPLAGVMKTRHSALLRLCRSAAGSPTTCDRPHLAEQVGPSVTLPAGKWPGLKKASALAVTACKPFAVAYLGGALSVHPDLSLTVDDITQAAWTGGNRATNCWLNNKRGNLTTTTVRGGLR
ncbi:MAG: septum formation family protein [Pseudonocardiales bacterium]